MRGADYIRFFNAVYKKYINPAMKITSINILLRRRFCATYQLYSSTNNIMYTTKLNAINKSITSTPPLPRPALAHTSFDPAHYTGTLLGFRPHTGFLSTLRIIRSSSPLTHTLPIVPFHRCPLLLRSPSRN